jgi:site-specific recombinase XerD
MTQHNKSSAKNDKNKLPYSVLDDWLAWLEQQGKSRHTLAAYRRGLAHFLRWSQIAYGGTFDPAATLPRDVRDWQAYQQTVEKAAPASINQRLVALDRFFAWAQRQGLVARNPTEDVTTLRLPQRQPKGLSSRDLRRLLRAVHAGGDLRDIALVEVLAGTGLRVGELLALQIGDIVINERSGLLTVRRGKHGGFRQVPLTSDVRHALSAYLESHPDKDRPEALLWTGTRGPLSNRSSVVRLLNKYAYLAEIEPVKPHALRHMLATRYLAANPDDLRGLAALLGHSNLNTVMIYTEPSIDDLERRMERVEAGDGGN